MSIGSVVLAVLSAQATPADMRLSVAPLVDRVKGSVVTIQSLTVVRRAVREDPYSQLMREFLGTPAPTRREAQQGLGSGFVVDRRGTVLTNNHVVAGADDVRVVLADGRVLEAQIVGADNKTDVAVLRIKKPPSDLVEVKMGDSDQVRVGDYVLAIGNPLGLGQTVTMGIVSAKNRGGGLVDFADFLQTDAAINQGNSGGPLFNFNGQVVGINSAIINPAVAMNVGFAIPINLAMQIATQLSQGGGVVRRGMLGVSTVDVPPEEGRRLGLSGGAIVTVCIPKGPAETAGIRPGDILVELAGRRVEDQARLGQIVGSRRPGETLKLVYLRGGRRTETSVTLTENVTQRSTGMHVVGLWVQEITIQDRQEIGLRANYTAFKVTGVDGRGPASGTMREGDIILLVDKKPVTGAVLAQLDYRLKQGSTIRLVIQRNGEQFLVELR